MSFVLVVVVLFSLICFPVCLWVSFDVCYEQIFHSLYFPLLAGMAGWAGWMGWMAGLDGWAGCIGFTNVNDWQTGCQQVAARPKQTQFSDVGAATALPCPLLSPSLVLFLSIPGATRLHQGPA